MRDTKGRVLLAPDPRGQGHGGGSQDHRVVMWGNLNSIDQINHQTTMHIFFCKLGVLEGNFAFVVFSICTKYYHWAQTSHFLSRLARLTAPASPLHLRGLTAQPSWLWCRLLVVQPRRPLGCGVGDTGGAAHWSALWLLQRGRVRAPVECGVKMVNQTRCAFLVVDALSDTLVVGEVF